MAENFWTVGQQVLILFLLIGVGFLCGKLHVLNENAVKCCADVVLYIVTPCIIVQSFMREYDPAMLKGLLLSALAAFATMGLFIAVAHLIFRDRDPARRRVLRFCTVFSNCGYMSFPLQEALLGATGVFYGAAYVAVFNVILWTYGLLLMSGDKKALSGKKLVLNPGILGLVIGLVIFLFSIPVPSVLSIPIGHLAALNTPIPMLIIGFYLAQLRLREALRDKRGYVAMALRLVILPLLALAGMVLCGLRGPVLIACTIAVSAPVATAAAMFSAKFGQDTLLTVNLISLSTLFSIVTMPLIVGLAQIWG